MLDRTDFASWKQRIRLYCRGKENGVNILKSIDEGPYQMGIVREPLLKAHKEHLIWVKNDLEFTPACLLKKRIDIWDNVKMLLEGSELTKEYQESQLYDDFEHFRQHKGESIHDYYGRFVTAVKLNKGLRDSNYDRLYSYLKQHETHAKENKMMLERFSQNTVDPLALMLNVSNQQRYSPSSSTSSSTQVPQHLADNTHLDSNLSPTENLIENLTNTLEGVNPRGGGAAGYGGVGNVNPGQARPVKCYNYNGGQDKAIDDDVDEQHVQDLALNVDNVFQAEDCDAFNSDVDEAPTAQTMFMANDVVFLYTNIISKN
nr:hypothetical protein [Tanacetum cinerariifolium]